MLGLDILDRLRSRQARYRTVFGTPDGKRVLADLYDFCGIARECHVRGEPDMTHAMLGRRRVALRIANILGEDAETMLKRVQEIAYDQHSEGLDGVEG